MLPKRYVHNIIWLSGRAQNGRYWKENQGAPPAKRNDLGRTGKQGWSWKKLRAYEVDVDSYIDADGFNVTGTTRAEIHDNIRKVDDYLENYQDKMNFKEYLWNIAD